MNRPSGRLAAGLCIFAVWSAVTVAQDQPLHKDKPDLLVHIDAQGTSRAIVSAEDWAKRRAQSIRNMERVMGVMPPDTLRVPLDPQIVEVTETSEFVRRKMTIAVEPGDRLPFYLMTPKGTTGKAPAMLCLHQTIAIGKKEPAGLGDDRSKQYALELTKRGYVTLSPDYPGFGDYEPDVYAMGYVSATMKGIWNHMRCVDFLQSLPEVDPNRIGVIGHSLGGHNALFVSVFDQRLKVAVTSCGFCSFGKYYGGDLTGWTHKGYMPRIAEEFAKDPARMPFDFPEVLAAIAPRAVFVNAPLRDANFDVQGVYECLQAAKPVFRLLNAADRLAAIHPDTAHDFSDDARSAAYRFVDGVLRQ